MNAAFVINEIIFRFVVTHAWVLSYQFICNIQVSQEIFQRGHAVA
jgi:hypothetical protein